MVEGRAAEAGSSECDAVAFARSSSLLTRLSSAASAAFSACKRACAASTAVFRGASHDTTRSHYKLTLKR
jgi:hypothetical protein